MNKKFALLLGILVIILCLGLTLLIQREKSDLRHALRFCNSLIPKLQAAKQSAGSYPETIPASWLQGQELPRLLTRGPYYHADSNSFTLWIKTSKLLIDNLHSYNSEFGDWAVGDCD